MIGLTSGFYLACANALATQKRTATSYYAPPGGHLARTPRTHRGLFGTAAVFAYFFVFIHPQPRAGSVLGLWTALLGLQ